MSELNQLHSCAQEKPELYETVQLFFEDEEKKMVGRWTGRFWWSHGHEVVPMWWQYFGSHFNAEPLGVYGHRRS